MYIVNCEKILSFFKSIITINDKLKFDKQYFMHKSRKADQCPVQILIFDIYKKGKSYTIHLY